MKAPSAPTLPKCRDCGCPNPRVVTRGDAHEWLCASCEYKRSHSESAPTVPLPRERRPLPLQSGEAVVTVAALYVDPNGTYANLPGVEVWDEARDARTYAGPWPVVAHPPCARWCQLTSVNQARWGAMIGSDGGTFAAALEAVERFGGVLEHPAYSIAWARYGLPRPARHGWIQNFEWPGCAAEVSQSAYGHPARKRTWLYYVGDAPPTALSFLDPQGRVVGGAGIHSGQAAGRGRISGRNASATPPAFRDVLLAMARSAATREVCA